MAKFCTKCGSPLSEDLQFCTNCGAAVAAMPATAPAATPAAPPVAGPAVSAAPAAAAPAPAAKAGSPILKIVLIVVGVLILLTALGIGSCVYVAYRIRQRAGQVIRSATPTRTTYGTPEVRGEEGGAEGEAETIVITDVPAYPGSRATGGSTGAAALGIVTQEFTTPDDVDKVLAFYKQKFGNKMSFHRTGDNALLQVKIADGVLATISISRDEPTRPTKINIMRMGK